MPRIASQRQLQSTPKGAANGVINEGSKEYRQRCRAAFRKVAAKYAWTAQQEGVVLRNNPLKLPPYRDHVFNRIAKADYGFKYRDKHARAKFWYPSFEEAFGMTLEGELDCGITVAERIEYLPGQGEITHDEDACRVLNLWRAPKLRASKRAALPKLFLERDRHCSGRVCRRASQGRRCRPLC